MNQEDQDRIKDISKKYNWNNDGKKESFLTDIEVDNLFTALNKIELRLKERIYLVGDSISLSDIRLFVTLIRFDAVYFNHFKTNHQHIYEYKNLWSFVQLLYNHDKIQPTIKFNEIKDHYFKTHPSINPLGIVPVGPNIEELLSN